MRMNKQNHIYEDITIDFLGLISGLWQKKLSILLITLASAIVVLLGTKLFITPTYTSEASAYVVSKQPLTRDYTEILVSRTILENSIKKVGLDITPEELREKVEESNPVNTKIIKISVSMDSPQKAKKTADAIMKESKKRIVSVIGVSEVRTLDKATLPLEPSAPNTLKNTCVGGFVGFVISLLIISFRIEKVSLYGKKNS